MSEQPETESAASGDFVQSLARGLAVILAFDAEHSRLSLSEVARRAGIPAASARRFLRTLETLGYVRSAQRHFMLTPMVLGLGFGHLSALTLPEIAQPHLEDLSRMIDESVSLAVLTGEEIVYVARVPARRIMNVRITIGTRFPAFATSMGRVLLAGLPANAAAEMLANATLPQLTTKTVTDLACLAAEIARAKKQGWALSDGELELGLRSIAVPVRDNGGKVVAALNISTSATRESNERLRTHHLPLALSAAEHIEHHLRMF